MLSINVFKQLTKKYIIIIIIIIVWGVGKRKLWFSLLCDIKSSAYIYYASIKLLAKLHSNVAFSNVQSVSSCVLVTQNDLLLPVTNKSVYFCHRNQSRLLEGLCVRPKRKRNKKGKTIDQPKVSHTFLHSEHNAVCKAAFPLPLSGGTNGYWGCWAIGSWAIFQARHYITKM
jgi:hypothetical protein